MKKSVCKKTTSLLLIIVLLFQIVSVSGNAIKTEIKTFEKTNAECETNVEPKILYEVEEKRNQYTKTFKMSDGSYSEFISTKPIHTFQNGVWNDITQIENSNRTLDEVTQSITENINDYAILSNEENNVLSRTSYVNNTSSNVNVFSFTTCTDPSCELEECNNESLNYNVNSDDMVIVVPQNINQYIGKTRATISAQIVVNCNDNSDENSEGEKTIVVMQNYTPIPENLSHCWFDVSSEEIDYNFIDGSGLYYWDISDLYLRWESGMADNNGVAFWTVNDADVTFMSTMLVINYKEIDIVDNDYDKYTIENGRAGEIYINELTCTPTISIDLLSSENEILPVSIKMIYSQNYFLNPIQYGFNWGINYISSLKYVSNIFVWENFEGTSIEFQRTNPVYVNNGLEKWTSESSEDILWVNRSESINNSNFSNNIIQAEDGMFYSFERGFSYEAKVTQIIDEYQNCIHIGYTPGKLISYIEDGEGKRFNFEYAIHREGGIQSLSKISMVDENGNTVNIDGDPIEIKFNYLDLEYYKQNVLSQDEILNQNINSQLSENNILLLTSVEYPQNEIIELEYNCLGNITKTINIDNQEIQFQYLERKETYIPDDYIENYNIQDETKTITTNILRKCEKKNNDVLINKVEFEYLGPYKRIIKKYDNNSANSVDTYLYFNKNLQKVLSADGNGNETFFSYNVNEDLSAYSFYDNDAENKLLNESFEVKEGRNNSNAKYWNEQPSSKVQRKARPHESTAYCMKILGDYSEYNYAEQTISLQQLGDISSGNIYAVFCSGYTSNCYTGNNSFYGVEVYANYSVTGARLVCSVNFDTSDKDAWQKRANAFKIDIGNDSNTLVSLSVRCIFSYQSGTANFDDILLKKIDCDTENAIENCPCGELCLNQLNNCQCECEVADGTLCNCVSCNSYTGYNVSAVNGNIISYKKTDGTKNMTTYYEYDSDGNHITSVTDENGIETNYTYNHDTGMLSSISDSNGITNYAYTPLGALKTVSMTIDTLSDSPKTYSTTYSYRADKVEKISHNGVSYVLEYDIYGNISKISLNDSSDNQIEELVQYEYTGDYSSRKLNSITYANGDVITYTYNGGNITSISFDGGDNTAYEYEYDNNGLISKITDYISGNITEYNCIIPNNDDDQIQYDVCIYAISDSSNISDPSNIKFSRRTEGDKTIDSFQGKEYQEEQIQTHYDSATGITVNSSVTVHEGHKFISANSKDCFERNINAENTAIDSEDNSFEMSSGNMILEKDLNGNDEAKSETFYYYNDENNNAGSQILGYKTTITNLSEESENLWNYSINYAYEYDHAGNITKVYYVGNNYRILYYRYYYNEANQIIREDNRQLNCSYSYVYDEGGNIITKKTYPYSENELGRPSSTITYSYDNIWKDKLVSCNGNVEYDELGNPISYDNKELVWNGRQLMSVRADNIKYVYTYDSEGYVTSKSTYNISRDSDDSEVETLSSWYQFIWKDGRLIYQYSHDNFTIKYLYDSLGEPYGMITHGEDSFDRTAVFYFAKDIHGNIKEIVDAKNKNVLLQYKYDAWGNVEYGVVYSDVSLLLAGLILAANNMLTYRGCFYDLSSGLYFLHSRCYNPKWGRFVNLDSVENAVNANTNPLSGNLFLYCYNDPVNHSDPEGCASEKNIFIVYGKKGADFVKQAEWMKKYAYKNKDCITYNVKYIRDFSSRWNSLENIGTKNIHLYLHGGKGCLYFYEERMDVSKIRKLKNLSVLNMVYLYSCDGGSKNSIGETVAGEIAKKVSGTKVRAVVNGSVYYRAWYQLFSYKPLTKEPNAYWADFHYGRYKGKMTIYVDKIGTTWRL